jgi:large subunit ribosomal protein L25
MEEIQLEVFLREEVGSRKVKTVRKDDFVPAVVYGGDSSPTNIKVGKKVYEKIMRAHKGESVVFHLNVKDGEKALRDYTAILKDEQFDPVTDDVIHIDFHRISLTESVVADVPVVAEGTPIGVSADGGSLDQPMAKILVSALPETLPASIKVDVSKLKVGEIVHAKDLSLPEGVKCEQDLESIVFSVIPPKGSTSDEDSENDEDA